MTASWFEDYRAALLAIMADMDNDLDLVDQEAACIADRLAEKRAQIESATELVGMAGRDSLVYVCRLCGQEVKERRA